MPAGESERVGRGTGMRSLQHLHLHDTSCCMQFPTCRRYLALVQVGRRAQQLPRNDFGDGCGQAARHAVQHGVHGCAHILEHLVTTTGSVQAGSALITVFNCCTLQIGVYAGYDIAGSPTATEGVRRQYCGLTGASMET